eukprot:2963504-Pleurochrysis_carterae.AAC.2
MSYEFSGLDTSLSGQASARPCEYYHDLLSKTSHQTEFEAYIAIRRKVGWRDPMGANFERPRGNEQRARRHSTKT